MVFWPLIERDLRVALRRKKPVRLRLRAALAAAGFTCGFLLVSTQLGSAPKFSPMLHGILFGTGLYVCVVQAVRLTADVFAEERRNQTLGLLYLAGLGSLEVFAAKTFSSVLIAFGNLLALVPFLAVPLLVGGVSFQLFTATVACLPVILPFAISVSLLASVLCREESTAMVVAGGVGGAVCLLTPGLYAGAKYFAAAAPSANWLLASPAYAPYLILHWTAASPAEFWRNLLFTVGWSVLFIVCAGWALNHSWQDNPDALAKTGWRKRWHEFMHGSRESRRRLADYWFGRNPFVWLALYDRHPLMLAWGVLAAIGIVWCACFAAWPTGWLCLPNFFITALVLNTAVSWIMNYAAARRIGEDRRSGALELLLTSTMPVEIIVTGQMAATRLQFRAVRWALAGVFVLMMATGFFLRGWNGPALFVYLGIWFAILSWAAFMGALSLIKVFWISLSTGRPGYSVWKSSGLSWVTFLWIGFSVRNFGRGAGTFPTGSAVEVFVVSCIIVIACLGALAGRTSHPFRDLALRHLRATAARPLPEPPDPRFKLWKDVSQPFPMSASEWELRAFSSGRKSPRRD
jgi:hypothetical protein